MELKVSSPNPVLSPSDCLGDPEEKEISDDDDDDRNHKHRRRDTRSQSLEGDASEQVFTRPFRKRNKPFENGYSFRESDSPSRIEKRRFGLPTFSRGPSDLNQRIRVNQPFSGDLGPGRGRGRDPRFSSSVDIASQMHQGSVPPSFFAGRGLPTISNAQGAPWGTFGLIPGMPNGGLDPLHSLSLQGSLRPPINPSLNIGIPRQRCRDFEERGFCLRGDMCPLEHGINRIVVEDVQSLSQFNLPVSLPNAHVMGSIAGSGAGSIPSVSAPSSAFINHKSIHSRSSKTGLSEQGFSGTFSGSGGADGAGGADLYDPDQPLWNNGGPEASSALLGFRSPKNDETAFLHADPSDRQFDRLSESIENDHPMRSNRNTAVPNSTTCSVWGRIGGSKTKTEVKNGVDSAITSVGYTDNETMESEEAFATTKRQGKQTIVDDVGPRAVGFSSKMKSEVMRNIRRPSQKAQRTLFVNGIPLNNNRADVLLSHFRKFGEVIDIYIPSNSERAFVQFSKKEEAEAALMAPDAVMGNRFIKLWWANRDSITDDGTGARTTSVTPRGAVVTPVPPHVSVASKAKDSSQSGAPKIVAAHASDAPVHGYNHPKPVSVPVPASDHSKPVMSDSPKASPLLHKKLENLELLKEELRKKQEMLDQKRNDFRRKLDQLAKATGSKGEIVSDQSAKRQKLESKSSATKAAAPTSADTGPPLASPQGEKVIERKKSGEIVAPQSLNTPPTLQEPTTSKHKIHPSASIGTPSPLNRFKLDNRPTSFRISPPLPSGFASVSKLQEHFLLYGDLSSVDLEELEAQGSDHVSDASKMWSAVINFATRRSAEVAFVNGKCWQGHNLQFTWLTSSNAYNEHFGREKSPPVPRVMTDGGIEPLEKSDCTTTKDASSSGHYGSQSSERSKGGAEQLEQGEEIMSSPVSSEERSSKDKFC